MCRKQNYLQFLNQELTMLQDIRRQYSYHFTHKEIVSIIAPTNKLYFMKNIFDNYHQQNYKNKELIIILNNNQLNINQWVEYSKNFENVRIYQLDETTKLGECLNFAVEKSEGSYICKFDDDDYYAPNFITDLMTCFLFTDASIVGKTAHFVYFENVRKLYIFDRPKFNYVKLMPGGAQIVKRDVFHNIKFANISLGEDGTFVNECNNRGFKLFSADPFNFVAVRHCDKSIHAWKMTDQEYMKLLNFVAETDDYKTLISVGLSQNSFS